MKRKKIQLICMLLLLVILLGAYLGMRQYSKKQSEQEELAEQEKTILSIPTSDITAFSYQLEGETLSFTKQEESWIYDKDSSKPMSTTNIESMLSSVSSVTYDNKLDNVEDLSAFGFDSPSNVITITTKEKTYTITIGQYNDTLSAYYITVDSIPDNVYLISGGVGTAFYKKLDSLIEETTSENTVSGN